MTQRMSRRKFLKIAGAAAGTGLIAACGAQPAPNPAPSENETVSEESTGVEAASQEEQLLRVSAQSWIIEKWPVEEAAKEFEANHPGVKVEVSPAPSKGEGETYLLQWSQDRTNVDVALGGTKSDVAAFVGQDLLVEFDDDFFADDFTRDKFISAFMSEGEFAGGKQYGVPLLGEVMFTTVRRDWYEETGLLDAQGKPIPPKDLVEWKQYAEALTVFEERRGLELAWGTNFMWLQYLTWLVCLKGSIYESEGSTMVDFSSETAEEILQFWQDIVAAGYASTGTFTDQNAGRNDFKAGLVASLVTAHSRWPEAEGVLEEDGVDRVTAMPILAGAPTVAFAHLVYVPKVSPVPELAQTFIKEQIFALENQQWSADQYGKLPTLQQNYAGLDAPEYQDILAAADKAVHEPNYKEQAKLNQVVQSEMEKCISGVQAPKDTLAKLRDAAQSLDISIV